MYRLFQILLYLVITSFCFSQIEITGKIVDDEGSPMPGATIIAKGTTYGTVSNLDGEFLFSAPTGSSLTISYVKHKDIETKEKFYKNVFIDVKLVRKKGGRFNHSTYTFNYTDNLGVFNTKNLDEAEKAFFNKNETNSNDPKENTSSKYVSDTPPPEVFNTKNLGAAEAAFFSGIENETHSNDPKVNKNTRYVLDNTPPKIKIWNIDIKNGQRFEWYERNITLEVNASDASGIFEVLINGEEVYPSGNGSFKKTVLLAYGDNSFFLSATDLKQNTVQKEIVIERFSQQRGVAELDEPTNDIGLHAGTFYALIIGVEDYVDHSITDLDQPVSDARTLYNVLVNNYTFESQNIKLLKNPTKNKITESLDFFLNNLTENDNFLIFYAGHGYWDERMEQGYWLSSDSEKSNRGTWLSNSTIRDYMRAIESKHTLLITDACFGGGIFKSRNAFSNADVAVNQLYKLPSRKAFTSGALSEVPDKSVFIEYLVKRLNQNSDKYLSSEQLFASFKIAVINNSSNGQVPQFGEVKETGDEGGDFIFIRK